MDKTFEDLLMDIKKTGEELVDTNDGVTDETGDNDGVVDNTTAVKKDEENNDVGDDTSDVSSGDNVQDTDDVNDAQGADAKSEEDNEDGTGDDVLLELDDDESDSSVDLYESKFIESVKDVVGEEIKTAEQLKEYVKALKSEVSTLKEQVTDSPLKDIPEQLKEAVEYAKEGKGDYLELLEITSVDYTKLDPATLAETEIRQYFYDSEGKFDEDGFIEYIDNVPEKELEIRGRQRINTLVAEQATKKAEFLAKQEMVRERTNSLIRESINKLDSVGPFKLKESDKQKLINKMVNGNYKNVFMSQNNAGEVDFGAIGKDLFIRDNYEKMINVLKTKLRNDIKADAIREIGNQDIVASADVSAHSPEGDTANDPIDALINKAKATTEANSMNSFFKQLNKDK